MAYNNSYNVSSPKDTPSLEDGTYTKREETSNDLSDDFTVDTKDPYKEEAQVFLHKGDEIAAIDDDDIYPHGCCSRQVEKVEIFFGELWKRHRKKVGIAVKVILFLLYIAYFGYCVHYRYHDEGSYILTVITVLFILKIIHGRIRGTRLTSWVQPCLVWYGTSVRARVLRKFLRYGLYIVAGSAVCVYIGINVVSYSIQNFLALAGILLMLLFCFVFSARPSRVNWHPVFWGFVIQFAFATITLRTEVGYNAFKWMGDVVYECVRLSDKGSIFVLGASFKHDKPGFFFECAGVIVFFNSCIFVMEYFGILEFIVLKIGGALAMCLETGPVESVVAAANIFIGLAEAPLLVRPYLPSVTKSELHAIMVCGFSSISGAFMAIFIKVGAPASHLLTAAIISAPAALAITKLYYPEVERVNYASQRNIKMRGDNSQRNALQACSDGALFSIKLVAAIMVNMIAFVSIMNLIDTVLIWIGDRAGLPEMSFDFLCSYALYPIAFMMGADPQDCLQIGSLIGIKLIATPFVAYADLGDLIRNRVVFNEYVSTTNGTWHWSGKDVILDATNTTLVNGFMTARSEVVCTYALCGISAFPAIGFTMGTLIPMSPERKQDIIEVIIRAYIAGNIVNLVTGAVAGVMYHEP